MFQIDSQSLQTYCTTTMQENTEKNSPSPNTGGGKGGSTLFLVANCGELCIYGYCARTCRHCVWGGGRRKLQHPHFFNPAPQSRQRAWLFLQSSELGLTHPFSRKQVQLSPQDPSWGGGTLCCGRKVGGVPIPTWEQTLRYSTVGIYVLCALRSLIIKLLSKCPL